MNPEPLSVTIERFNKELLERGYSKSVKWQYGKVCRDFHSWCEERCITNFSERNAKEYCLSVCGTWDCGFKLPYNERVTLRCIRMLNSSYLGLEFEKRTPLVYNKFHTQIGRYIDNYEDWCSQNLHIASVSVKARIRFLSDYDAYLSENKVDVSGITAGINDMYFSKYAGRMTYRRTLKHYLREFLQFLYECGYTDDNLSTSVIWDPSIPRKVKLPSVYSMEEIKEALLNIDRTTAKGKRDYVALLLAAEYGLRASDIVRLKMTDIDWDNNKINIIQYKTKMPLTLPLTASVGNAIIDFMKNGHPQEGGALIICHLGNVHKGEQLHPAALRGIVGDSLRILNLKANAQRKVGMHSFRHSLASNMLSEGIPIFTISSVLGHSIKQSTQAYLKLDICQLAKCSLPIPPVFTNEESI